MVVRVVCNKLLQKLSGIKQKYILSLTIPVDQEFESDLAGGKGSGLGYLRGYGQMLAKAAVI